MLEVLEVMRCVRLCMLEVVEGGQAQFRSFEISIVTVFSLQSATSYWPIEGKTLSVTFDQRTLFPTSQMNRLPYQLPCHRLDAPCRIETKWQRPEEDDIRQSPGGLEQKAGLRTHDIRFLQQNASVLIRWRGRSSSFRLLHSSLLKLDFIRSLNLRAPACRGNSTIRTRTVVRKAHCSRLGVDYRGEIGGEHAVN